MIRLVRPQKPQVLADHEQTWLSQLRDATKSEANTIAKRYNHPEVRRALETMCHKKCAFCESRILHVTSAHIEHFRPKGLPEFAHLIFRWENLLLACPRCNSGHKRTQFPVSGDASPLLIDPSTEEPQSHLIFDSKSGRVIGRDPKGKATVQVLGLNRVDLWERRLSMLRTLGLIAKLARTGHVEALELLKEAADDKEEYSAFAKQVVAGIPTP